RRSPSVGGRQASTSLQRPRDLPFVCLSVSGRSLRLRRSGGGRTLSGQTDYGVRGSYHVKSPIPGATEQTMSSIQRRKSVQVSIGPVRVGGTAPIVVQSMTNTDTADIEGTTQQVKSLARAGSELVRITVNTAEAAEAVPHIRNRLDQLGVTVPLIGDFHFNGHKLLREHPACAEALAKYRINPGNVGRGSK